MRPTAIAFCLVVASGLILSAATGGTAESRLDGIKLPPGFRVALYAEVPDARSMTLGEKGTLFVGTRKGEVYAVLPGDTAEGTHRVVTIARGLDSPNGVAFRGGALYVPVGAPCNVCERDDPRYASAGGDP